MGHCPIPVRARLLRQIERAFTAHNTDGSGRLRHVLTTHELLDWCYGGRAIRRLEGAPQLASRQRQAGRFEDLHADRAIEDRPGPANVMETRS